MCRALRRRPGRSEPRRGGRLDKAGHDTGGAAVRMLGIDPTTFHRAYNAVANSTLWFVHHMLYDTPTTPAFGEHFRREWASYEAYNRAFAEALAEDAAADARVLVQDYHLTLVPRMLRERRPDVRIAHFSHTPWAPPDYFRAAARPTWRARPCSACSEQTPRASTRAGGRRRSRSAAWKSSGATADDGLSVTYDGRTTKLGPSSAGRRPAEPAGAGR